MKENIQSFLFFIKKIKFDAPLFLLLLILSSLGLFILYSASNSVTLVLKQSLHFLLAFALMIIIAQIPPHHLKRFSPYLMLFGILLLLLVLFFGININGAQRWLGIGSVRFQPSEMLKIIAPMAIAAILSEATLPPSFKRILVSIVAIGIITFLILQQPDLGTAILIATSGLFVLFFSGLSWRIIFSAFALLGASLPLLWHFALHAYQKQRILTFINPESDPLNHGYHIVQSKITIGSGGIWGKGWFEGSQSQLNFLPEHSTDFIFSVLAEEFGFMGILLLFLLYLLIIYRCFSLCLRQSDNFARLLMASLTLIFFTYIFVNIGMVSGLLPVVGVPLPLISYGGTSIVTIMAGFGIIFSLNEHKRYND